MTFSKMWSWKEVKRAETVYPESCRGEEPGLTSDSVIPFSTNPADSSRTLRSSFGLRTDREAKHKLKPDAQSVSH